jgi:hypothetical protein
MLRNLIEVVVAEQYRPGGAVVEARGFLGTGGQPAGRYGQVDLAGVAGSAATAGRVLTSVSVSGAFVGSPLTRPYASTLQGECIARLDVRDWHERSGLEHEGRDEGNPRRRA